MNWKKFDNPYWFELISVLILAGAGIFFEVSYFPGIVVAVLTTVLLDVMINRVRGRKFHFSTSAVITGLLIGSILYGELWVFAFAGIVAILSKHAIQLQGRNIFNPAALGILLSVVLFSASDVWWSATQIIPIIILGLLVAWKMMRLRIVLSFLISFFILNIIQFSSIQPLGQTALSSFLALPLFLAFFMLTEPKTTPSQKQFLFGPVFAVIMFALLFAGIPYFLLLGLLMGNLAFGLYRTWK